MCNAFSAENSAEDLVQSNFEICNYTLTFKLFFQTFIFLLLCK